MLQPKKNKITTLTGKKSQPTGTVIAPTMESVQYTDKNAESLAGRKKGGFHGSETEGVKVDKSGVSTAKPFSRKVVVSPGGHTRIIGSDGTVVKEGRGGSQEMKDAVKASEKKVNVTNFQRERNARANNLVGGTAENVTDKEVDRLVAMKQATGTKPDERIVEAARREELLRNADKNKRSVSVRIPKK